MSDETNASSSEAEETVEQDLNQQNAGADPTNSDGEDSEGKARTQRRIQQLLQERKEANERARNLEEFVSKEIGTPEEREEYRRWKSERAKAQASAEDGDLTPSQLEAVRKLIDKAHPEIADIAKQREIEAQERAEAMFDSAEETIRDLAKKAGIGSSETQVARIAGQVMMEIKADPKLMRLWRQGNVSCVTRAFETIRAELIDPLRKGGIKKDAEIAQEKRRITKVPTIPAGNAQTRGTAPSERERGLSKDTHARAWAIMNQE